MLCYGNGMPWVLLVPQGFARARETHSQLASYKHESTVWHIMHTHQLYGLTFLARVHRTTCEVCTCLQNHLGKLDHLYWPHIAREHVAIITIPSPPNVLTESTIFDLWHIDGTRPSTDVTLTTGYLPCFSLLYYLFTAILFISIYYDVIDSCEYKAEVSMRVIMVMTVYMLFYTCLCINWSVEILWYWWNWWSQEVRVQCYQSMCRFSKRDGTGSQYMQQVTKSFLKENKYM